MLGVHHRPERECPYTANGSGEARPRPHGSTPNPRTAAPQAGHRPPSAPSRTWPHSPHVRSCRVRRAIAARASTVSSLVSASDWVCVEGGRRRPVWGSMRTGTAGRIASRVPRRSPGTGRRMRRVKRRAQRSAVARVRCRIPHPSFTVSPEVARRRRAGPRLHPRPLPPRQPLRNSPQPTHPRRHRPFLMLSRISSPGCGGLNIARADTTAEHGVSLPRCTRRGLPRHGTTGGA